MATESRPGHTWRWSAGSRDMHVDDKGWLVQEPDGTWGFTCSCGVQVSGPAKEVQHLLAVHVTMEPPAQSQV